MYAYSENEHVLGENVVCEIVDADDYDLYAKIIIK